MDQDATWYGGKPRPRRHCVRWEPSSPKEWGTAPPSLVGPCLLWPNGHPSQQLLSSCTVMGCARSFFRTQRAPGSATVTLYRRLIIFSFAPAVCLYKYVWSSSLRHRQNLQIMQCKDYLQLLKAFYSCCSQTFAYLLTYLFIMWHKKTGHWLLSEGAFILHWCLKAHSHLWTALNCQLAFLNVFTTSSHWFQFSHGDVSGS